MKNAIILIGFILLSIASFSQTQTGGIFLRVNDSTTYVNSSSTTALHSAGYADIWYSNSSDLYWVWNGSAYVNWIGAFWPLAGSATLTGQVEIDGAQNLWFGQNTQFSEFRVSTNTTTGAIDLSGALVEVSTSNGGAANVSSDGPVNITATTDAHITASDTLQFSMGFGLKINNNTGTTGQVLTSNGGATPPTWATPSSGGATAPGTTGNVPYKSAGGGFQAETAFSYDSATNTLDADIVTVNDDAYSESGWNGSVAVPTKNAIRDKIESMYNADLTAIANMAPANGDFIYRESGIWVKKTTAETAAIIYAVGGDPAFITNLSIHGDAGAGVILTNQANTEQGFNNTGRTTRYFDATGYNYIQVACQVSTLSASANTPRLYPRYSTDNSTYNLIGSGSGTNIIDLSSTGHKLTDWIALPTGAKALVYFSVGQNGGNGTADPEIGYLEVRLKK